MSAGECLVCGGGGAWRREGCAEWCAEVSAGLLRERHLLEILNSLVDPHTGAFPGDARPAPIPPGRDRDVSHTSLKDGPRVGGSSDEASWRGGVVAHHSPHGDLVSSWSTPGRWYLVNEDGCDHPSYFPPFGAARTKSCKHVGAALEQVIVDQEANDPVFRARLRAERLAPFNASAFVD